MCNLPEIYPIDVDFSSFQNCKCCCAANLWYPRGKRSFAPQKKLGVLFWRKCNPRKAKWWNSRVKLGRSCIRIRAKLLLWIKKKLKGSCYCPTASDSSFVFFSVKCKNEDFINVVFSGSCFSYFCIFLRWVVKSCPTFRVTNWKLTPRRLHWW